MLSPWKKRYDKPRPCIKKQRHHFAYKGHIVKAMVFPVVMYGCESWTIKKDEHQRIETFKLWCWRLLRVPWTARRSNQSILKESTLNIHWKDWCCEAEAPIFSLLLMRSMNSLDKTLILGKIKGRRRGNTGQDDWMASPTQWTWVWASSGRWWRTGNPGVLQLWGCKESDRTVWLSNSKSTLPTLLLKVCSNVRSYQSYMRVPILLYVTIAGELFVFFSRFSH